MNKVSKAIRPKRPQIKRPVFVPPEKKERIIPDEVKVKISGTQLVLQTENKIAFLQLSHNQLEMLKVAFKEIV